MSTDYPHHDSPFPKGMQMFLGHAGMTEAQKRAILWDNGARLFGLPVPSSREASAAALTRLAAAAIHAERRGLRLDK